VRYAITVNGAQVYDREADAALARAEIPVAIAIAAMEVLDGFDCIYDCYKEGMGRMTRSLRDRFGDYLPDPGAVPFFQAARIPVPDLKKNKARILPHSCGS
jgi:hypothetical protein